MGAQVSRLFRLHYGHPDGCGTCEEPLCEGDQVAYVDDELTCEACVEKMWTSTRIGRKAKDALQQRRE